MEFLFGPGGADDPMLRRGKEQLGLAYATYRPDNIGHRTVTSLNNYNVYFVDSIINEPVHHRR